MKKIFSSYVIMTILFHSYLLSQTVTAQISFGELIDKITILTIKKRRITHKEKLQNIIKELNTLLKTYNNHIKRNDTLDKLQKELESINELLWDIEDAIRIKERDKQFDEEFIKLARSVYITNDQRFSIKKKIDSLLGSVLTEEKSYENYI